MSTVGHTIIAELRTSAAAAESSYASFVYQSIMHNIGPEILISCMNTIRSISIIP